MPRIETMIEIDRPIDRVFSYVTTPANWPKWHPASLGVSDRADHPLGLGEQVTERFCVAGRKGEAVWTVAACEPPRRWTIDATTPAGHRATINYTLSEQGSGTRFERVLEYEMPGGLAALLEPLLLRRKVEAESAEALRRLKAVLEAETETDTEGDGHAAISGAR